MKKRRGRGEGSVEQLPDGRWRAILSLGKSDGKRVRRKFYGRTKAEALGKMREAQASLAAGTLADPGRLTVGEWIDRWLALKAAKVQPGTLRDYADTLKGLVVPHLGPTLLRQLAPLHVEGLFAGLAKLGQSAAQQRRAGLHLSICLKDAVRLRLLASNPAAGVKRPKAQRKQFGVWTAEEVRTFLKAAEGHRLRAYFVLALDTGCRPGELLALTWDDVDLANRTVAVTKSLERERGKEPRVKEPKTRAARRMLSISAASVAALLPPRIQQGGDLVFQKPGGGHIHRQLLSERVFQRLVKRAGVPRIRLYDLRHTAATLLLAASVNIKVVSERLGHARIQTTLDHYVHCLPGQQQIAAEAFDRLMSPGCPPPVVNGHAERGHNS